MKIHGITYRTKFFLLIIQCLFCQHVSSMLVSKNILRLKFFLRFMIKMYMQHIEIQTTLNALKYLPSSAYNFIILVERLW